MNFKMIGKLNSHILLGEAIFMLPPLVICLFDKDYHCALCFCYTILIILAFAGILRFVCRNAKSGFFSRDGFACVAIAWIVISFFGCLPFWFSGQIPNFIDAFFEIVSGFTTTGASILSEVESMSRGMLYWRSFSHWLGGMGVLVFLLAIAPLGGRNSGFTLHLLRAESPGPDVSKLVPKMKQTAQILYLIYFGLTFLDFVLLALGGMPIFEAVCTAFGTAGTGGFGVKNDSIAGYSPYIQNVCTVFMLLFGVNFSLYYLILMRNIRSVFKDEEFRLYIAMVTGCILLITLNNHNMFATLGESLRHNSFTVASIISTTGFATTDFDKWPTFSKAILVMLMALGACAGSTGGGLKCGRLLLLCKALKRNINKLIHPKKVASIHTNDHPISEDVIQSTAIYLVAYAFILIVSFIIVSIDEMTVTTNFTSVLSCLNNIGPALEMTGPTCNYAGYSVLSKIVLIFDMLAGRLEIFPMLVLFAGLKKR